MLSGAWVIAAAIVYVLALFALAWAGDKFGATRLAGRRRAWVYAFSLAVYCTSWTYYGSVGVASKSGLDFLPIYIGPILVIGVGRRLVRRIAALAQSQNVTTVADFVASRYGKSGAVAAVAALIALVGAAPYIALQLQAIGQSMLLVTESFETGRLTSPTPSPWFSFAVAALVAVFAMAFGTRRIDPREHQDGLILAIAAESIVKLTAFLAVGAFVVWWLYDGLGDVAHTAQVHENIAAVMRRPPDPVFWIVTTLLSASAVLLLPRQFHVTIVENRDAGDIDLAAKLFPTYLVAINLFVVPLAIAGLALISEGTIDRDLTVLALPLIAHAGPLAVLTMLGGISAATGMVVVESVALSVTISNDIVLPLILRRRVATGAEGFPIGGARILLVRRAAILAVVMMGFVYTRTASATALASMGLLSFAAVAQILPAFVGGLVWRRGTARGALAGMIVGALGWLYLLLAPTIGVGGAMAPILEHGPFAIAWLRPAAWTGFLSNPFLSGVVLSLGLNVSAYVAFSLSRRATSLERLQAIAFVGDDHSASPQAWRLWRSSATTGEVRATVARYLGEIRAAQSFDAFARERGRRPADEEPADAALVRHAEDLLSPAIGASTTRLVLSLLMRRSAMSGKSALKLVDDASAAIQSDRDQLQHALDHSAHGVSVFDANLALRCWNREFAEIFRLPAGTLRPGVGLDEIVRLNAARGVYGPGEQDAFVAARIDSLYNDAEPRRLRLLPSRRVIEIRSSPLPDGGIVATYADVTATVEAEEALAAANERLERRVAERTADLERLNAELARAKTEAEDANVSKTRFLAAAGHDILQPLNAARLYAGTLSESAIKASDAAQTLLAGKVEASLEGVEEILGALLEISRLDAGGMKAEVSDFAVAVLLKSLEIEFGPSASAKGLKLRLVASSLWVRSDRRLLRRLLQNLVSNAVKYTSQGEVLVGCRREGGRVRIEVRDTGQGIPDEKRNEVFEEFVRLDQGVRAAPGLGLGLSIVKRLARVLDHDLRLESKLGRGSLFAIVVARGERPIFEDAATSAAAYTPIDAPLAGLCVLVVDNEPQARDAMCALLEAWGCAVLTAADVGEALHAARIAMGPLDMILADFHLDDGNGLDVVAALRAELGADLPAVLTTADRSPEVREAAALADVTILNKPVRPAPLRALLTRKLSVRASADL